MRIVIFAMLLSFVFDSSTVADIVQNDVLSRSGGTDSSNPNSSSTDLAYGKCSSGVTKQALLKIDIIGTGANQVPPGSTISSATLRLKAIVGGDGILYRVGESWDSTPTWNEVGDALSDPSDSVGVGLNTGQSMEFDVTEHVQLWASGTFSQGWVIKGPNVDCAYADIYSGAASSTNRPRLTVSFTPPDTTPPKITGVRVTNGVRNYDVPSGSGAQMKTVPVATPTQVIVTFSEDVKNTQISGNITLKSAITGSTYPTAVTYNSTTHQATVVLISGGIAVADKVILTVSNAVTDNAGNVLDSEWTNPTSVTSTGTSTYPSGNGSAGSSAGGFIFHFVVLPGDYTLSNVVDLGDFVQWRNNDGVTSGATFEMGDGDGDGDVDSDDYNIYRANDGTDFRTW